jgi:hypothetical protein
LLGGVVGGGTVSVEEEEPVPLVLGGESGLLGGRLLRPLELPVAFGSAEPPVPELGELLLPLLELPVPVSLRSLVLGVL